MVTGLERVCGWLTRRTTLASQASWAVGLPGVTVVLKGWQGEFLPPGKVPASESEGSRVVTRRSYLRECFPAYAVLGRFDHPISMTCSAARRQEAEVYAIASPFLLRAAVVTWGKAGLSCGLLGFLRARSLRPGGEMTDLPERI